MEDKQTPELTGHYKTLYEKETQRIKDAPIEKVRNEQQLRHEAKDKPNLADMQQRAKQLTGGRQKEWEDYIGKIATLGWRESVHDPLALFDVMPQLQGRLSLYEESQKRYEAHIAALVTDKNNTKHLKEDAIKEIVQKIVDEREPLINGWPGTICRVVMFVGLPGGFFGSIGGGAWLAGGGKPYILAGGLSALALGLIATYMFCRLISRTDERTVTFDDIDTYQKDHSDSASIGLTSGPSSDET